MGRHKRRGSLLPVVIGIAIIGGVFTFSEFGSQPTNSPMDRLNSRTADQATQAAFSWAGTLSLEGVEPSDTGVVIDTNRVRRNYVLAIDASGSMGDNDNCAPGHDPKFTVVRPAVEEFLRSLGSDDYLALMSFQGKNAEVLVPLGPVNPVEIAGAVDRITPNGGTPIGGTLMQASAILEEQAQRQAGYGEYTIVMVTDGAASDPDVMNRALDTITLNTPIVIQTIGFCIRSDHALNDPSRVIYRAADDGAALREGLAAAVAESRDFTTDGFEQLN